MFSSLVELTCDLENLAVCSIRAYICFGNSAASKSNTRFCSTKIKHKCNTFFAWKNRRVFSATLSLVHIIFIGQAFCIYLILHKAQWTNNTHLTYLHILILYLNVVYIQIYATYCVDIVWKHESSHGEVTTQHFTVSMQKGVFMLEGHPPQHTAPTFFSECVSVKTQKATFFFGFVLLSYKLEIFPEGNK